MKEYMDDMWTDTTPIMVTDTEDEIIDLLRIKTQSTLPRLSYSKVPRKNVAHKIYSDVNINIDEDTIVKDNMMIVVQGLHHILEKLYLRMPATIQWLAEGEFGLGRPYMSLTRYTSVDNLETAVKLLVNRLNEHFTKYKELNARRVVFRILTL
uniref:Orf152 n=1 Tax=Spizellomyces punctatus TaxID=109760 RepID=Q950T1_SPIPN|nr:orf152 [Spizellomyces punctatus]AAK84227.1 orf152 [Spizellomyces punctatus]